MAKAKQQEEEGERGLVVAQPQLPTARELGLLAHYRGVADDEGSQIVTTLNLTDRANQLLCQRALASNSVSLWDLEPDTIIEVTDLIRHYAESEDEETGEVRSGPMLTLIGPKGVWHTMSKYAFRDVQRIAIIDRCPPWHPPIRLRAERSKSGKKRFYQSVILVD